MQAATGITEPDYGAIFDDMVLETGCSVEWDQYTHPRVEVELAFVLKKDAQRPRLHHLRRPERHRLRGSGPGDPGLPDRDGGPDHRGHHRGQRRDGRHGGRRQPGPPGRRGPALGLRHPLQEPDRGGNRRRRRGPGPPGQRRALAGQQDRRPRGRHEGRRHHPRRLLHPARCGCTRAIPSTPTTDPWGAVTCRFE